MTIIVKCPECGLQAIVQEDRKPALLDRWRREHERMQVTVLAESDRMKGATA